MEFEFSSQYLIFMGILLCLNIILFYLFYKLYLKTNDHSDKLDKLDKLLAEIFINKEILFDSSSKDDPATSTTTSTTTSTPTTETTSETTSETTNVKTKKRAKKEKDPEPEQGENLNEISETIHQVQND